MPIQDTSPFEINPFYQYDDEDIVKILEARISQTISTARLELALGILVSTPVNLTADEEDENHLVRVLNKEKENTTPRIVLIPCNKPSIYVDDEGHWVGIAIEINSNGDIASAKYVDSSHGRLIVLSEVQQMFARVCTVVLQAVPCLKQKPDDGTGCGVYLIENLLIAALSHPVLQTTDVNIIRKQHVESIRGTDFYETFRSKQFSEEEVLQVPQHVESLFFTALSIRSNIQELLINNFNKEAPITASRLKEEFMAVYDEEGALKLQLRNAARSRTLTPFLYRPLWSEHKIGYMRNHSSSMLIGGIGSAISLARGPGFNAAFQAAQSGATMGGVAGAANSIRGAFTILDPAVFGLTALASATAFISEKQSRVMAKSVNEALIEYNRSSPEHSDPHLIEAQRIMDDEFGGEDIASRYMGKYPSYRITRWLATSNAQFEFAHLVLAQIMARRRNVLALKKFQQIYQSTGIKVFKAMALIGQIGLLVDMGSWESDAILTPEKRKEFIDAMVADLNQNHREIVQQYLGMVFQAYSDLHAVMIQGFARAFFEFETLHPKLDAIINFKELNCLRYMELDGTSLPAGKIAEVVFTFVQGLCYSLIEEYHKYRKEKDATVSSAEQESASLAVLNKLRECKKLITSFGLRELSLRSPKLRYILEDIDKYTEQYLARSNHTAGQPTAETTQTPAVRSWLLPYFRLWGVTDPDSTQPTSTARNIAGFVASKCVIQ